MEAPDRYRKRGRPPDPGPDAIVRTCPRHGPQTYHFFKSEQRYRCKRCIGEAVTRRHRRVKQTLVADFGGACLVCGYDRLLGNLHFHHVDPAQKSFAINMARGLSLAAYREEAKKCVLVCANCHGEIEAGLVPCPPAGSKLAA